MDRGAWRTTVHGSQRVRQDLRTEHDITFLRLIYEAYEDFRRRQWQPTPVLLPGKSHGWRSLVGCSPWGRQESDTTERLHFDFSLSSIGEGNGNPLQYSCLGNPRDRGAWWAAVCGVTHSRTRLKQLSSSSMKTLPISISSKWPPSYISEIFTAVLPLTTFTYFATE